MNEAPDAKGLEAPPASTLLVGHERARRQLLAARDAGRDDAYPDCWADLPPARLP